MSNKFSKIIEYVIGFPKELFLLLYDSTCNRCKNWLDIEKTKIFGVSAVILAIILSLGLDLYFITLAVTNIDFSFLFFLVLIILAFAMLYLIPTISVFSLAILGMIVIFFFVSSLLRLLERIPSEKFKNRYKKIYPYLSFFGGGVLMLALLVLALFGMLSFI